MKKIVVISAVIIVSAGILIHLGFNSSFNIDKTFQENDNSIKVLRKSIGSTVLATGIIKPQIGAEVKVGAQVSGIVSRLYVEIGSNVKKGDLLAQIENTQYLARVNQVKAIKERAETEKKYANIEMQRVKKLRDKGYAADQDLEAISKQYEIAIASVKQAEADLEYAQLQLNYTKIISPINGVVASVSTQEGETVAANFTSPTFVTIIDLNRLEVWAYVDETDIGRIKLGQTVKFSVDTYPTEEIDGIVEAIYPKAEIQNNVVNYITVIKIENKSEKIFRPEMTTTVNVDIDRKDNVLVIPKKYVKREDGRKYVFVLDNQQTKKVFVETGISDKKNYEIISGVTGNERIVLPSKTNEK